MRGDDRDGANAASTLPGRVELVYIYRKGGGIAHEGKKQTVQVRQEPDLHGARSIRR